jgi:hypothetical protein
MIASRVSWLEYKLSTAFCREMSSKKCQNVSAAAARQIKNPEL